MKPASPTHEQSETAPSGNAAIVVGRLKQIEQVLQVVGQFKRNPVHAQKPLRVISAAPVARASVDATHVIAHVDLSLTLVAHREGETPPLFERSAPTQPGADASIELATISASFVIIYSLSPGEPPTESDLAAFGRQNAVFNAWPYWREFVASASARAGLPLLSVPVLRLPSSATASVGGAAPKA